jgi:hypothetical protein
MNSSQWNKLVLRSYDDLDHYPDCTEDESTKKWVPMNECMCNCYQRWWFEQGVQYAQKQAKKNK